MRRAVIIAAAAVAAVAVAACSKGSEGTSSGSGTVTAALPATAEDPGPIASAELGRVLYEKKGCAACHSIDGSPRVGPSLLGVSTRAAATTRFTDGTLARDLIGPDKKFPAVRDYIIASFMKPLDHIVEGFTPVAPSFEGVLKPHEVESLAHWIETLVP